MFGRNKNLQHIFKVTAKGIVEHSRLEVGTLCCASPDTFEAWELDYNQQAKDERTGEFVQFISSLNKQPLKIYTHRPQSQSQSTAQIAAQQFDEKMVQIHKEESKKSMLLWLGIIAAILLVIIGLIVLLNVQR